jgi:hypothetical protein
MLRSVVLVFLRSVRRLIVTRNVVPSSPILVTLMNQVLSCSETSVFTRATQSHIAEDGILSNHHRETLNLTIIIHGYKFLTLSIGLSF